MLCLNCRKKLKYGKYRFVLPTDVDFCDKCGKWRPVVSMKSDFYFSFRFLPVTVIKIVIYYLFGEK